MEQERIKSKEHLKCDLTPAEIKEAGAQLARAYSEITDIEEQKKSVASDFKARIDGATAQASVLARKIQNGYEYRDVACEMVFDYDEKLVYVVRLDNGDIVKQRVMTSEELQKKLFDQPQPTQE